MKTSSHQAKFHTQQSFEWKQKEDTLKAQYDQALIHQEIIIWKIKSEIWSDKQFSNDTLREAELERRKLDNDTLRQDRYLLESLHAAYHNARNKAMFHEGMKLCFLAEVYEKVPGHILPYEQSRASWDNIT
ncbi:MAG: hypothetical protein AAGF93_05480 [Cyanobacteria bacterium P01_H01_bin.105]